MAAVNGVHLEFKNGDRYKLKFRMNELRQLSELVKVTYKDPHATIDTLLSDPFGGWPYLLQWALKAQLPEATIDEIGDLMDRWVNEGNEFQGIRRKFEDAFAASGYWKRKAPEKPDKSPNETGLEPT